MNKKKVRDRQADLEKDMLLDPEKIKTIKRKKQIRGLKTCLGGLIMIIAVGIISFKVVSAIGKSNLQSKAAAVQPKLEQPQTEDILTEQEKAKWQEGWIKYNGTIYAYNEDIMTFLFMGIDKHNEVTEVSEGTDGGQADALFMLVLNPHDKSVKVIGINRNTMTDVDLYNEDGAYMTTVTAQIAVQHGFGNGLEESCEYQVNAVQKLFYNIPVHGYCAVNMDAVISLTDLVGGIEVNSLGDVKPVFPNENQNTYVVRKGETVLLDGRKAYSYVRYRDLNEAGSADRRLERQQQFLEKFIRKIKETTTKDITFPVKLYNAAVPHMVTNVTVDEVAYLASVAKNHTFDSNQLYSLQGETVQGERFEEYYIDEAALYALILDIFYEPVKK